MLVRSGTPEGTCQACHGAHLSGAMMVRLPVMRTLPCDEAPGCHNGRITLAAGTVSCNLCHKQPGAGLKHSWGRSRRRMIAPETLARCRLFFVICARATALTKTRSRKARLWSSPPCRCLR